MKICIMGDTHAEWALLNKIIDARKPDIILQCGDFGYWPNAGMYNFKYGLHNISNGDTKIYWCDGNHEDHWSLRDRQTDELHPNVFYMKRGSVLELPDGQKVLFMGGANSIDKNVRTFGIDWFPEEIISQKDIDGLPDPNEKIDIVISHTCPSEFRPAFDHRLLIKSGIENDPSEVALSYVLNTYRPKKWFFGHFHMSIAGQWKDCEWMMLNTMPLEGCCYILEEQKNDVE